MKRPGRTIAEHFADVPDPRVSRTRHHKLSDILTIAVCAVISGAEGWVDVEEWGNAKEAWLKTFLDLPNGIPSHDTFGRVFSMLDPDAFRQGFVSWVQSVATELKQHVVIDGQTLRRTFDRASGRSAIHMVSAWARESHLVLAQVKTDDKSNEITAIPKLLELLSLHGCIVSIDAMGCQKNIAEKIVDQGGDYVLAVKGNQPAALAYVAAGFEEMALKNWEGVAYAELVTEDEGHGRLERRTYRVMPVLRRGALADWPGVSSAVMVDRYRDDGQKRSHERHYYISTLLPDVDKHAAVIRGQWSIENELHWALDVQFNQDRSRIRKDHAPENFTILNHIALNLLRSEKSKKVGVKAKRLVAACSESYLLKVLGN